MSEIGQKFGTHKLQGFDIHISHVARLVTRNHDDICEGATMGSVWPLFVLVWGLISESHMPSFLVYIYIDIDISILF